MIYTYVEITRSDKLKNIRGKKERRMINGVSNAKREESQS